MGEIGTGAESEDSVNDQLDKGYVFQISSSLESFRIVFLYDVEIVVR